MFYVNFNSLNRDVYIELHNSNMNDVYNMYKKLFSYWTLYGDILYDVGKVLYKYCTSTFPISTLTIMFMYIMWWYIYEYHSCNCFVEINSIQFNSIQLYIDIRVSIIQVTIYIEPQVNRFFSIDLQPSVFHSSSPLF